MAATVAPLLGQPVKPPVLTPLAQALGTVPGNTAQLPAAKQALLAAQAPPTPPADAPLATTTPASSGVSLVPGGIQPMTTGMLGSPAPTASGTTQIALPPPEMAGPMTQPLPASPSGGPDAGLTPFGPGNDLTGTQINPTASANLTTKEGQAQTAQDIALSGLQGLSSAPDRQTLAEQQLKDYIASTDPQYQRDLRQSEDLSATMGRVGSGMAADDIVRLGNTRQQEIVQQAATLANTTAGQGLSDQLAKIAAAQGVTGTLSGTEAQRAAEEAANRGELRTERGYQAGASQQNVENAANQAALEASLQNQEFGQKLAAAQYASGDVAQPLTTQATNAQNAAAGSINAQAIANSLGTLTPPTSGTPAAITPASGPAPLAPTPMPPANPAPDPYAGAYIDPATGLPIDPNTGLPVGY